MNTYGQNELSQQVKATEMVIASRLAELRKRTNISATQLAEITGVDTNEIYNYEHANSEIPASVLVLFSAVFGVDFDYFYRGDSNITMHDTNIEMEETTTC